MDSILDIVSIALRRFMNCSRARGTVLHPICIECPIS